MKLKKSSVMRVMKSNLKSSIASSKQAFLDYIALFGSLSTLICCALPALLVSLGLGAVLAGVVTKVPGLIWVSEHKDQVFTFAGVMLALNGWLIYRNRNSPCPLDPVLRMSCLRSRRNSLWIYIASVIIFSAGFIFAYML